MLLLLCALTVSSGRVRLFFAGLSLVAFAAGFLEPKRRNYMAGIFLTLFLGLNIFYNGRNLDRINPLTRVETQTMYQPGHYEDQAYPDNFLRLLAGKHKVKVPYEVQHADVYIEDSTRHQEGNYFNDAYYKETNYARFFRAYAKEFEADSSLLDMKETGGRIRQEDFQNLGYSGDMLRYTFLLNEDGVQESAYFWYAWYYYSFMPEEAVEEGFTVYARIEDLEQEDTLVVLWDEAQNLYLMTEEYYENEVKEDE